MVVFTRAYSRPSRSFFLFGPRGSGKTTWLKQQLPQAKWFNLLSTSEYLRLTRQPDLLRQEIEALEAGAWVVIDEIQRLPDLLNEVHSLITDHGKRYRFALTGSSARKLKRAGTNLLAGRAITHKFFPLTGAEIGYEFETDDLLRFGCLPTIRLEQSQGASPRELVQILESYVDTYLRQEIKEEALVKKLEPFARFLEVAALANAQTTNMASIARDAGASRPTVQGYFEVLTDTLIGDFIPAWQPKARIKEAAHSKFYFFDTGAARALAGRARAPLEAAERGHLLETLVCNELRAWNHIHDTGAKIRTWRTPQLTEVDFIIERANDILGIEVKASAHWKSDYSKTLKALHEEGIIKKAIGVYLGDRLLKDGPVQIMPLKTFLKGLEKDALLP